MFAKIAVQGVPYAADKPYDYRIPPSMNAVPGLRVLVPFGRGRGLTEGMILSLAETSQFEQCKDISALLDKEPLLDAHLLRLCIWVRERFFCPFYDALKAALPAGLWLLRKEWIRLHPTVIRDIAFETVTGDAHRLLTYLYDNNGTATAEDCEELLGKGSNAAIRTLTEKGICKATVDTRRRVPDKTDRHAALSVTPEEAEAYLQNKRAGRQRAVLELLCQLGSASVRDICYHTGATTAVLKTLEKNGQISLFELPVYRPPESVLAEPEPILLNDDQQAAYQRVLDTVRQRKPACGLLHGVTGSGKTSVYIQLTRQILEEGGSVLLLVPEIALTPQLMSLFSAHFGDLVALLHSGLSLSERMEQWQFLREGKAKVALGTRSAVFAPLENLRLIIMDEEQEGSYQSSASPRYHARDVAKFRCVQTGATLLLGSATPSVDSYQAALEGKHFLMRLNARYNRRALPETHIVDMRSEQRQGSNSTISVALHGDISQNLAKDEQTILLLNRRGHNRQFVCAFCGETPGCKRCSVSLAYHSANGRFMCHYCGHSEVFHPKCRSCGEELKPVGSGTQKVVSDLEELFPSVPILRMDTDNTGGRGSHQKLLDRFRRENIPILVGTQMVAKGLDFENVTLVGVLEADCALWMEDYRAHERAFCLFAQVIGRAGRGERPGRALIQTYAPHHPLIRAAAAQDYEGFFNEDIALRRLQGYPPFGQLLRLTLSGQEQNAVLRSALRVCGWIAGHCPPGMRVIGPAPDRVAKVNSLFRYHIHLLGGDGATVRRLVRGILENFPKDKQNRGVRVFGENG